MPVYEYNCDQCGSFTKLRALAESGALADCPTCGSLAAKVFPMVNLRTMQTGNRKAWERNEQSAHAPHLCSSGCSHRSAKPAPRTNKRFQSSTKLNSRPWMLGH